MMQFLILSLVLAAFTVSVSESAPHQSQLDFQKILADQMREYQKNMENVESKSVEVY